MAKKRLFKSIKKHLFSSRGVKASIIGSGAIVGASSGVSKGVAGHRKDAAKEGAIAGGLIGGALAFSPSIARFAGRAIKSEGMSAARKVKRSVKTRGKVVFRRIRGRIVPIRKK